MSEDHKAEIQEQREQVSEVSDHIQSQLGTLEKFIARRFDEISMEINATSQQVDMAESGITSKFSEIMDVIQAISYKGDGMSPANAGVELDAVVDMTEDAANRILDAAGRIGAVTAQNIEWTNQAAKDQALESINKDVEEIFLACSFQDITSQRIKKTLENLKSIEERLGGVLDKLGIKLVNDGTNKVVEANKATTQADIDALFSDD